MSKQIFRGMMPHLIALGVFLVVCCAFFFPQLQGKSVVQGDILHGNAIAQEVDAYKTETGKEALWTNAIFGGMPTYMIRFPVKSNKSWLLERTTRLWLKSPIGIFLSAMIGMYILLLCLGVGTWTSIFGAVVFGLMTNHMVLFEAGHNSKLRVLFQTGPMLAGLIMVYRKRYLTGGILFAMFLAVGVFCNHYQMTYYLGMYAGIYVLMMAYHSHRNKELEAFAKGSAVLLLGTLIALACSSSRVLTAAEYAQDTMRGDPILQDNQATANSSSETKGLSWEYAMDWSNGSEDLLAMLVPRAAGGSGREITGTNSNLYKDLQRKGARLSADFPSPLYHGSLPFTSGPAYMGALLLFLFMLGAVWVKGPLKWWLVSATVLSILMSMGKHFGVFNQILFDTLPLLNKFRAPSSILTVTCIFIPILGALGLAEYFRGKLSADQFKKGLYVALATTAGVALLLALVGPALFDFTSASDPRLAQSGYDLDALLADRKKYLRMDALRSVLFIILGAAALFAHSKSKLNRGLTIGVLALLSVVDLWGINRRYVSPDSFNDNTSNFTAVVKEAVDDQILSDPDPHYRIHDLTRDPFNDSRRAYYHKMVGGYHPAKLQRYQDLIDYYIGRRTQHVLDMLNTKYFIVPSDGGQPVVRRNPGAMGNAWFVEGIVNVENADEELKELANIDPRASALVHKEFENYVSGFDPVKNGTITLTSYTPDHLTYTSESQSDQLAVFSEIWYGPDKGWQAYLDGQPVDHIRANYILRALSVPSGAHTVEFKFRPQKFVLGQTISMVASSLLLLGFIGVLGWRLKQWATEQEKTPVRPKPELKPTKKKASRRKKKPKR